MVLRGFSAKALDGVISSGPRSSGCIGCLSSLNMVGRPCGIEVIPRHGKENVKLAVEKSTAQKMPNLIETRKTWKADEKQLSTKMYQEKSKKFLDYLRVS
jgi:hypothetical protein